MSHLQIGGSQAHIGILPITSRNTEIQILPICISNDEGSSIERWLFELDLRHGRRVSNLEPNTKRSAQAGSDPRAFADQCPTGCPTPNPFCQQALEKVCGRQSSAPARGLRGCSNVVSNVFPTDPTTLILRDPSEGGHKGRQRLKPSQVPAPALFYSRPHCEQCRWFTAQLFSWTSESSFYFRNFF